MMQLAARFLVDRTAAAAAEMALLLPLLVVLMFGGLEAGNYFWNAHKVVKAVRDGSRYAARLPFSIYSCGGSDRVDAAAVSDAAALTRIKNVTRTGSPDASKAPMVPNWTNAQVSVVSLACDTATTKTGIFEDRTDGAYRLRVIASANYLPLFSQLGFSTATIGLRASSESVVMGL